MRLCIANRFVTAASMSLPPGVVLSREQPGCGCGGSPRCVCQRFSHGYTYWRCRLNGRCAPPGVSGLNHASALDALLPEVVNVGCCVRPLTSHGIREARLRTSRSHASPPGPVTGRGGWPTVDSQHHSSRMSVLG